MSAANPPSTATTADTNTPSKAAFEPSPEVARAIQLIINHCSVNVESPLETMLSLDQGSIASWWQVTELEGGHAGGDEEQKASHSSQPSKVSSSGFTTNSQVVTALPQDTTVSRLREKIDEMLFKYTEEKIERKRLDKELKAAKEKIEGLEAELDTLVSKKKKKGWGRSRK